MVEGMTINDSVSQNIESRNVEFTYPTRPILIIFKKLNLFFPAGMIVTIVGLVEMVNQPLPLF